MNVVSEMTDWAKLYGISALPSVGQHLFWTDGKYVYASVTTSDMVNGIGLLMGTLGDAMRATQSNDPMIFGMMDQSLQNAVNDYSVASLPLPPTFGGYDVMAFLNLALNNFYTGSAVVSFGQTDLQNALNYYNNQNKISPGAVPDSVIQNITSAIAQYSTPSFQVPATQAAQTATTQTFTPSQVTVSNAPQSGITGLISKLPKWAIPAGVLLLLLRR